MGRHTHRQRQGEGQTRNDFPKEPMQPDSYLVHTVFGVSPVMGNSCVYVQLGDEFVRKSVGELGLGELVLYRKDGIPGVTLEQVEGSLLKSARYASTAPVLFKRLGDTSFTTTFAFALYQGMASSPLAWPESLRGVAVGGCLPELDDERMREAAQNIRGQLERSAAPLVTAEHIRYQWLRGGVIAPRHKNEAVSALLPLAPGLGVMLSAEFDEKYKLYTIIRQTVMRAVSTLLKGEAAGAEKPASDPDSSLCVKPEIRLVVEQFAADISTAYAAGRVLKIEPLFASGKTLPEAGILADGVVTGQADPQAVRVRDLSQLERERSLAGIVVNRIVFAEYLGKFGGWDNTGDFFDSLAVLFDAAETKERRDDFCRRKLAAAGLPLPKTLSARDGKERDHEASEFAHSFFMKLHNGSLDAKYACPSGGLLALFDTYYRLTSAIPFDFSYRRRLQDLVIEKATAMESGGQAISTRTEFAEDERIKKKYGLGRQRTAWTAAEWICRQGFFEMLLLDDLTPNQFLEKVEGVNYLENAGDSVVDDSEAKKIFQKLGLGNLSHLLLGADERVLEFKKPFSFI